MRWRLATVGGGTDRLVGRSAAGLSRRGGVRLRELGVQPARRLSRRRSRSESPPQMPKRSSCPKAYSRQSPRTSHRPQTFLASLVDPPFSGTKASGSVWAHRACSCHGRSSCTSSSSLSSRKLSSVTAPPWLRAPTPVAGGRDWSAWPGAAASGRGKNTHEITRASCPSRQGVRWYCLLLDRRFRPVDPAVGLVAAAARRVPPRLRRRHRGLVIGRVGDLVEQGVRTRGRAGILGSSGGRGPGVACGLVRDGGGCL